ncbi:MAG TPA: hypothetical protein VKX49_02035 [Bryobacteraceae bacterium]|nr:hypothetical protein [Bryobacteraceae bacterium]
MKQITLQNFRKTGAALALLCLALAGRAKADCMIAANQFTVLPRLSVAAMPPGLSLTARADGPSDIEMAAPQQDEGNGRSIVGLWKTTSYSGAQVVDEAFEQWNSDGTEVLNDNPSPLLGNICLGVFIKAGAATYKLKHPSWTYDNNGNLNGTAIIREQITVAPSGNTYSGTFTVDLFDLNGTHLVQLGGTVTGQRITVDF